MVLEAFLKRADIETVHQGRHAPELFFRLIKPGASLDIIGQDGEFSGAYRRGERLQGGFIHTHFYGAHAQPKTARREENDSQYCGNPAKPVRVTPCHEPFSFGYARVDSECLKGRKGPKGHKGQTGQ
ncbi:MAG: hypothetical protein BWY09_00865 [Candidatus Hydrogenedentes bacterium ADurb.Bin179]|nr:MAG: hypothetical protein BWY09_00865 [Candidatus Hydrogenedentes bacterium ADurb.Bin179]